MSSETSTAMSGHKKSRPFLTVAVIGFLGLFGSSQTPEQAVQAFAKIFIARDAEQITKLIHPDIAKDKEVTSAQVEGWLRQFRAGSLRLESATIDQRLPSPDGKTQRVAATILFRAPPFNADYQGSPVLSMKTLWIFEKDRWWIERPLSTRYFIDWNQPYPTSAQEDVALRFEATLSVLQRLGLPGNEDAPFLSKRTKGSAASLYRELIELHPREHFRQGLAENARGVDILLKAAAMETSGIRGMFYADFPIGQQDTRNAIPWNVFKDYAEAALARAREQKKKGKGQMAQSICRRVISLGRQFLDEGEGLQTLTWGLTFQIQGARGLAQALPNRQKEEKRKVLTFVSLASRRLDLLKTALVCLDEMEDYKPLNAAMAAVEQVDDPAFQRWGVNTLAILAFKGAPANEETLQEAGAFVLLRNPNMQRVAAQALERYQSSADERLAGFVAFQKAWVMNHQVFGSVEAKH